MDPNPAIYREVLHQWVLYKDNCTSCNNLAVPFNVYMSFSRTSKFISYIGLVIAITLPVSMLLNNN